MEFIYRNDYAYVRMVKGKKKLYEVVVHGEVFAIQPPTKDFHAAKKLCNDLMYYSRLWHAAVYD